MITDVAMDKPSSNHWEFVQNLLHDLQAEEDREQIAYLFGQWRLSIKAFRRVEAHRMNLTSPTELDVLFHRACVTDLISFGTLIEIAARGHDPAELSNHGVKLEFVIAIIQDLQNTLDEWHAQVSSAKLEGLRDRIFNATPELNLTNTRA